jgi:hypothetical protein
MLNASNKLNFINRFVMPPIYSLLITIYLSFKQNWYNDGLIKLTVYENFTIFSMIFIGFYLIFIIVIMPVDSILLKINRNKLSYFVQFNGIGVIIALILYVQFRDVQHSIFTLMIFVLASIISIKTSRIDHSI